MPGRVPPIGRPPCAPGGRNEMRIVQRRHLLVAMSLLVLISVATTSARARAHRVEDRPGTSSQVWIGTATTRGTLARIDPDATAGLLGAPRSITLGEPIGAPVALAWSSERRFAKEVADRTIPSSVQIVLYDPEGWDATPPMERRSPVAAMLAFGALARA